MQNVAVEYDIAIISALSAIIGAIVGAGASLLSTWVSKKVNESGFVEVFCRIVCSKSTQRNFGIYRSSNTDGCIFDIPMWIEIANTALTPKYIRDFNIVAYNNKNKLAEFTQIQGTNLGEPNEQEFGDHQSYSFLIDGKSIIRFNAEFMLKESEIEGPYKEFNILKARYFNEKGKRIEKPIFFSEHPIEWKTGSLEYKKEWVQVSKRKKDNE